MLIQVVEMAKLAEALNNLSLEKVIIRIGIAGIKKLIPQLPDPRIQLVYRNALTKLLAVDNEFQASKGSFAKAESFCKYLANGINGYLSKD